MDYVTPANNYAVVLPDGELVGFEESEMAQGYINNYYREKIKKLHNKAEYKDLEINEETSWQEMYTRLGVDEGECKIYKIDDVIETIRESAILEEEKEELIKRIMDEHIDLNINDFGVDDIFLETENYII